LEFHAQDAARLAQLPDGSVDLVVCFEALEHMPSPECLLREFQRVLRPGGIFVGSVPNLWLDEQGRNPVPCHLHVYDHEQFHMQIGRYFDWRALYRQNAGGGWKRPQARLLRAIPDLSPSETDCRDAEWWIAVAAKGACGQAS
jgi:SAM-dependent methyltransferase